MNKLKKLIDIRLEKSLAFLIYTIKLLSKVNKQAIYVVLSVVSEFLN